MSTIQNLLKHSALALFVGAALITASACDPAERTETADCHTYDQESESTCHKYKLTDGTLCKWNDTDKTCAAAPSTDACKALSDADCEASKMCHFDKDKTPKCSVATVNVGTCLAVQTQAGCDTHATDCRWSNTLNKCFAKADVQQAECAAKSDADCKNSKFCTFDNGKAIKCNAADAAIAGSCKAIQDVTTCNADAACHQDTTDNKCKEKSTFTAKTVTIYTVTRIATGAGGVADAKVDSVVVSGDQNWVYFSSDAGKKLTTFNADGAANFVANAADASKWSNMPNLEGFATPGLLGKANLDGGKKILRMTSANKGAVVSIEANNDNNGIVYYEGNTATLAFKAINGTATHMRDPGANSRKVYGGIFMNSMRQEYLNAYIDTLFRASTNNNDLATLAVTPAALDKNFRYDTALATSVPYMISGTDTGGVTHGFFVSKDGISTIREADFGKDKDSSAVGAPGTVTNADQWMMAPLTPNNNVTSVEFSNGLLYIGLNGGGTTDTGGPVVYDPSGTGSVTAPGKADWDKKDIVDLAKGSDGKVWAVLKDELVEIKRNGSKGYVLNKTKFAAYDDFSTKNYDTLTATGTYAASASNAATFPDGTSAFTGAKWLGNHLMITTDADSVYFMTAETRAVTP